MTVPEIVEYKPPPPHILSLLGTINHVWAQLDAVTSASLFSLTEMDPVEFGILLGRIETQAKLRKMLRILRHRKDKKLCRLVQGFIDELDKLRSTRNTITHGYFIGMTKRDEILFTLPSDLVVTDQKESATELVPLVPTDLIKHVSRLVKIFQDIRDNFDNEKMRRVFALPSRIR
jgi:hypothetical protein